MRIPVLVPLFLLSIGTSYSQKELSNRIANYTMNIELDIESKKIYGHTQLEWTNPSDDEIPFLLFHMYYNAFKSSESTFMQEGGVPALLTQNIDNNCGWGWTHIKSMADESGNDLISGSQYIQTDDLNIADQTVLKVPLNSPVGPRETIMINFDWEAKIPQTMPRTGYNKEYYFMAQWFPKVGVYEPAGMRFNKEGGAWNCHQYHSSGEYYSDFGNYDVSITIPSNYQLASSGTLIDSIIHCDTKTYRHVVDDVIDFTWSASPHFVCQTDQYKQTQIKHYSYPYKADYSVRYFSILKNCMQFLEEKLGSYPYPTISVVDPPIHGLFTGGMEYPTLISSLSFKFVPEGIRMPETLVVHEFVHQYFMQMVATHEVEEPWMDEGLTTYMEGRILDEYLGEHHSTIDILGIHCGNKEWNRTEFFNSSNTTIGDNTFKSWDYKHGGYGDIAYNKVALWMQTLEGILGRTAIDKILKTYFQRWKFKHPCRHDFIDVVNEVVTSDLNAQFPDGMDWFFEQVLYGSGSCDYGVRSISNELNPDQRGYLYGLDSCTVISATDKACYRSSIILQRYDELIFPIDIDIYLKDGTRQSYHWNGKDRSHEIIVKSNQKVVSALIDPQRKIYLDKNFLNNSLNLESTDTFIGRFSATAQSCIQHILELSSLVI